MKALMSTWSASALLAFVALCASCGEVQLPDASLTLDATADGGVEDAGQDAGPDGGPGSRTLSVALRGEGLGRVRSNPEGLDCPGTCEAAFPLGSTVTVTASAAEGAVFVGWSEPSCRGLACEVSLDDDRTLEATFARLSWTLTITKTGDGAGRVSSQPAGIDCGPTCEASFVHATEVTLSATPDSGSEFAGWSGACSGMGACVVAMTRAHDVSAQFSRERRTLAVSLGGPGLGVVVSSPSGIDCGVSCSADFVLGAQVALTAEPQRNYRFAGWSGACQGTAASCTVAMDQSRTVTALFEFQPQLVAGFWHVCATNAQGDLRCWGQNDQGQLGYGHRNDIGDTETPNQGAPGGVDVGAGVEVVAPGFSHTCAILQGGAVRCWGRGSEGQLGYDDVLERGGTPGSVPSALPDVALQGPAIALAAGFSHTCALLASGGVQCWGSNEFGQIGYAGLVTEVGTSAVTSLSQAGLVSVSPTAAPVVSLVGGSRYTCVLLEGGDVRCFGDAQLGQLGYGDQVDVGVGTNNEPSLHAPVSLGGSTRTLFPATGAHTCVLLAGNGVRCWGSGAEGRLGYGSADAIGDSELPSSQLPLVMPAVPTALEAGGAHTCALFGPQDLRCWGRNAEGQLGYGDADPRGALSTERPTDLPSISAGAPIEGVAAGGFFTCVRLSSGGIKCWGDASHGQTGYGDTMPRGTTPATVPSLLGLVDVF
ncbi:MAG: hypothetical protein H6740_29620 [Alphaproteobacteria bacterium]|nr:hypothetical protein [Alphaproteobacteria bacterium]